MIDQKKAEEAFKEYVRDYDPSIGKIRLKIVHTFRVAELSASIANALELDEESISLAWLIGLLHDIGRFEQYRRYQDYRDFLTEDHAKLGVEVLKKDRSIRRFIEDDRYDEIIFHAVLNHNKYALREDINERTLLFSKIIRDADKTDIFRVKIEDPLKDIIPFSQFEMEHSLLSKEIIDAFYEEKCIHTGIRKTPADTWITTMAFIYDYNFIPSLEILKEKDYPSKMIHRFTFLNEETREMMEEILSYSNTYIERKIQNSLIKL